MQAGFFSGTRSGSARNSTPADSGIIGTISWPPRAVFTFAAIVLPLCFGNPQQPGRLRHAKIGRVAHKSFLSTSAPESASISARRIAGDRPIAALHFCCPKFMKFINIRYRVHPSKLQSRPQVVCRLLLEKKKGWAE